MAPTAGGGTLSSWARQGASKGRDLSFLVAAVHYSKISQRDHGISCKGTIALENIRCFWLEAFQGGDAPLLGESSTLNSCPSRPDNFGTPEHVSDGNIRLQVGSKLLYVEVGVASELVWKLLQGKSMSRCKAPLLLSVATFSGRRVFLQVGHAANGVLLSV